MNGFIMILVIFNMVYNKWNKKGFYVRNSCQINKNKPDVFNIELVFVKYIIRIFTFGHAQSISRKMDTSKSSRTNRIIPPPHFKTPISISILFSLLCYITI